MFLSSQVYSSFPLYLSGVTERKKIVGTALRREFPVLIPPYEGANWSREVEGHAPDVITHRKRAVYPRGACVAKASSVPYMALMFDAISDEEK